jgi:hypothetical protein
MITGYQLAYNGRENLNCYVAGLASASGLNLTPFKTTAEGGKLLGIEWALPCSDNGVAVTGFDYQKATNGTKPRADAQKVISIQDPANGGTYGRWLVEDAYTEANYVAGTAPGAVTIPAPILFGGTCLQTVPVPVPCNYQGAIVLPALTLTNYIATAYG